MSEKPDAPEPRVLVADDAAALEVYASALTVFVARLLSKLDAPERVQSPEHQAFVAQAERELTERLQMRGALAAAIAKESKRPQS